MSNPSYGDHAVYGTDRYIQMNLLETCTREMVARQKSSMSL